MSHCTACQTALSANMLLSNQGHPVCEDCFHKQKMAVQVAESPEGNSMMGFVFALLVFALAVAQLALRVS